MNDRSFPEHLIDDLAGLLGSAANEVLPPKAQRHLFAAQRELFLAVVATVEHHSGRARDDGPPAHRRRASAPRRPRRVPVDD